MLIIFLGVNHCQEHVVTEKSDQNEIQQEDRQKIFGIIIGLYSESGDVKKKALEDLESYREIVLSDLDLSFWHHLDKRIREHPQLIIEQLGYKKEYDQFIEDLEFSGYRTDYYKKNPLRFLLKTNLLDKLVSLETKPIQQFWTCWIIGELGLNSNISFLLKVLKKNNSNNFLDEQCSAVWALAKINDRFYNKYIIEKVRNNNSYLQETIGYAIGYTKDGRVAPLFLDMLNYKLDSLSSRFKLGMIWSLTTMNIQKIIPFLKKDLKSNYTWLKIQQMWSLYQLQVNEAELTIAFFLTDQDIVVRQQSLKLLALIDKPSLYDKFIPLLKDNSTEIKILTLQLLGRWKIEDSVPKIFPLTKDPSYEVQKQAIITLGNIGSNQSSVTLLSILINDNYNLDQKFHTIQSLIKIKDKTTLQPILTFYGEEIFNNKKNIEQVPPLNEVIIALGDKESLFRLLKSEEEFERISALKSVPYFKEEIKDFQFLEDMVKKDKMSVKIEAIRTIGWIGYEDGYNLLLSLSKDEDIPLLLRKEAILSLGRLKQTNGTRELVILQYSNDTEIRWSAIEALGYNGDKRGVEYLNETYRRTDSIDEKVLIIFSLAMLGNVDPIHLEYLVDQIKGEKTIDKKFFRDYFLRMPESIFEKLTSMFLTKAVLSEKDILEEFFVTITEEQDEGLEKKEGSE